MIEADGWETVHCSPPVVADACGLTCDYQVCFGKCVLPAGHAGKHDCEARILNTVKLRP